MSFHSQSNYTEIRMAKIDLPAMEALADKTEAK